MRVKWVNVKYNYYYFLFVHFIRKAIGHVIEFLHLLWGWAFFLGYISKKEFKLLSLLASKPGKVFTREFILEQVWGDEVIVGDRTIDVHIRKLREKLGEDYIKTIKGIGYKFEF